MTRTRIALTLTTLSLTGLLGLTACAADAGPTDASAPAVTVADVADEAYALSAVGMQTGLEADPAPSASGAPGLRKGKERAHGVRRFLHKNTLHGEITVQGRDGVRTVVVQRGTVTAVDATTVTVKSTDGFTQTWTLGDKLKIMQDKKGIEADAIKTGVEIGVAGAKDGDKNVARLILIK
jgi:hypothetical protein